MQHSFPDACRVFEFLLDIVFFLETIEKRSF
jgi:hypothetical protein